MVVVGQLPEVVAVSVAVQAVVEGLPLVEAMEAMEVAEAVSVAVAEAVAEAVPSVQQSPGPEVQVGLKERCWWSRGGGPLLRTTVKRATRHSGVFMVITVTAVMG
jgi:actin-like ATPase involved in cell morphogenesis